MKNKSLDVNKLRSYFTSHLNNIYCAKSHLVERLPEIQDQPAFSDLQQAIEKTLKTVTEQLNRIEEIYLILNVKSSIENCEGMISLIEESYLNIHKHSDEQVLRDMSIIFYMQNIESLEMGSFHILHMTANKLENAHIARLLQENFDEAQSNRELLMQINAKYVGN